MTASEQPDGSDGNATPDAKPEQGVELAAVPVTDADDEEGVARLQSVVSVFADLDTAVTVRMTREFRGFTFVLDEESVRQVELYVPDAGLDRLAELIDRARRIRDSGVDHGEEFGPSWAIPTDPGLPEAG